MKRREFLRGAAIAGTGLLPPIRGNAAEPPPETTRLRLVHIGSICVAPQFVAKGLLNAEGFTDVQYPQVEPAAIMPAMASGEMDIGMAFAGPLIIQLDTGAPIVLSWPASTSDVTSFSGPTGFGRSVT